MISGASQADVALIMVPANKGGFEASIQKENRKQGIFEGQSKAHARLCKLLGIDQVIVGINKMDDPSVNWSQERYEEIKAEMSHILDGIGYKPSRTPFVPLSGWTGDNLIKASDKMPWWKGFDLKLKKKQVSGVTLLDALNNYVQPPKRKLEVPMRCAVTGQFQIKGVGTIVTGNILAGVLKVGDTVRFTPSGAKGKIFTIEMHHKNVEQAIHGDNIGMSVKGLTKLNMCKVGDIMFKECDNLGITKTFRASIFVQNHPGQLKCAGENGLGGFTPSCHVRTGRTAAQMLKIHWKKGRKSTGGQKVSDPKFIQANDEAEATFRCVQPFYCGPYSAVKSLGRVAFMDAKSLVMLGKVISTEEVPLE
jgi:elongation factor 1-alpha